MVEQSHEIAQTCFKQDAPAAQVKANCRLLVAGRFFLLMHEQELQEMRREKWRLNGQAIRTGDDARAFIESVGFCLLYPQRPPVLVPTFVGAYKGSDEKLPAAQMAFADPEAQE